MTIFNFRRNNYLHMPFAVIRKNMRNTTVLMPKMSIGFCWSDHDLWIWTDMVWDCVQDKMSRSFRMQWRLQVFWQQGPRHCSTTLNWARWAWSSTPTPTPPGSQLSQELCCHHHSPDLKLIDVYFEAQQGFGSGLHIRLFQNYLRAGAWPEVSWQSTTGCSKDSAHNKRWPGLCIRGSRGLATLCRSWGKPDQ